MTGHRAQLDPLLAWAFITGRCPECGAIAQPVGGGWMEMIHTPGCRIGLMPFPLTEDEERAA